MVIKFQIIHLFHLERFFIFYLNEGKKKKKKRRVLQEGGNNGVEEELTNNEASKTKLNGIVNFSRHLDIDTNVDPFTSFTPVEAHERMFGGFDSRRPFGMFSGPLHSENRSQQEQADVSGVHTPGLNINSLHAQEEPAAISVTPHQIEQYRRLFMSELSQEEATQLPPLPADTSLFKLTGDVRFIDFEAENRRIRRQQFQ